MPPNYDEIDPPPSYATLFPGNKGADPLNIDSMLAGVLPSSSTTITAADSSVNSSSNQPATIATISASMPTIVEIRTANIINE